MIDWNDKVKRLLKSELIKRGVSNSDLALMLSEIGIEETKTSIDSKISRGSFSASFFMQCLSVVGCNKVEIEEYENSLFLVAEPRSEYKKSNNGK
jgi:3-mercaptopyruvate sulfurtransferase SseA